MKLLAFSVYDEKAEIFGTPFFAAAIGVASRQFQDLAANKQTTVGLHPSDFKLYQVGHWSPNVGTFDTTSPATLIATATDFVKPETQTPTWHDGHEKASERK